MIPWHFRVKTVQFPPNRHLSKGIHVFRSISETRISDIQQPSSVFNARAPANNVRFVHGWKTVRLHYPSYRFVSNKKSCWNCSQPVTDDQFFCDCGKIQPLSDEKVVNYFDLLGYSESAVHVDLPELSQRMRQVQRRLHPDKFSQTSSYEQSLAARASSAVNKAYAVLSNPVDRFEYILSLHNHSCKPDEEPDGEFLFEILELNEDVELLLKSLNDYSSVDERSRAKMNTRLIDVFRQLSLRADQERHNAEASLLAQKWQEAKKHVSRYRYFLRILEQVKENEIAWKILEKET